MLSMLFFVLSVGGSNTLTKWRNKKSEKIKKNHKNSQIKNTNTNINKNDRSIAHKNRFSAIV